MKSRYRFTVEFEADRDMFPGWGHQVEDWIALATHDFNRQSHYNTSFRVTGTEEMPYTWDDEAGWVCPDFNATAAIKASAA